jgi:hypothetical protein
VLDPGPVLDPALLVQAAKAMAAIAIRAAVFLMNTVGFLLCLATTSYSN